MAHSGLRVKDFEPKINTNDVVSNVGGFAFGRRTGVVSSQTILCLADGLKTYKDDIHHVR